MQSGGPHTQRPRQDQGAAMIMVLLVVALLAVIATQVSSKVQFNLQMASNLSQQEQAYWYALAAEKIIQQQLNHSLNEDEYFHLDQAWAKTDQHFPFLRGEVVFSIRDEQACFNINALGNLRTREDSDQMKTLETRQLNRLLKQLGYGHSARQGFLQSLLDWLDGDVIPSGEMGAEDLYYSVQNPAYLSHNELIWQLSELNFLAHPLEDQLSRLSPLLCALPTTQQKININTLSSQQANVLQAILLEQIGHSQLTGLLKQRPSAGYRSADPFWEQLRLDGSDDNSAIRQQLAVTSEFFRARIQIRIDDSEQVWTSRFHLRNGEFRLYSRAYGDGL